jgi:hypothetical protein
MLQLLSSEDLVAGNAKRSPQCIIVLLAGRADRLPLCLCAADLIPRGANVSRHGRSLYGSKESFLLSLVIRALELKPAVLFGAAVSKVPLRSQESLPK